MYWKGIFLLITSTINLNSLKQDKLWPIYNKAYLSVCKQISMNFILTKPNKDNLSFSFWGGLNGPGSNPIHPDLQLTKIRLWSRRIGLLTVKKSIKLNFNRFIKYTTVFEGFKKRVKQGNQVTDKLEFYLQV